MRSGLVVIVGTLISYLINRKDKDHPIIDIIEEVPAGFEAMAIPSLNLTVLKEASTMLPSIVVILILEHISVAKAFSRTNNYTINSNQEILAIGLSNLIGSFFGLCTKENINETYLQIKLTFYFYCIEHIQVQEHLVEQL